MKPPLWLDGPTTADEAATGRRAAKAARKRARVQANVISQCDECGATDDAEHRLGRERHDGCGGTFRLYGVMG